MKVLKKGSGQKAWSVKKTCTGAGNHDGGCGSQLLVSQGDLFSTSRHFYDGSSEYYITFKCPECGVLTDIKEHPPVEKLPTQKEWEKKSREEAPG